MCPQPVYKERTARNTKERVFPEAPRSDPSGLESHVDVRAERVVAVLRVVVGTLHVIHAGRNGNRSAKMRAGTGQALEIGKRVERKIDLAGRAAELVVPHAFKKIGGKFAGLEKLLERQ